MLNLLTALIIMINIFISIWTFSTFEATVAATMLFSTLGGLVGLSGVALPFTHVLRIASATATIVALSTLVSTAVSSPRLITYEQLANFSFSPSAVAGNLLTAAWSRVPVLLKFGPGYGEAVYEAHYAAPKRSYDMLQCGTDKKPFKIGYSSNASSRAGESNIGGPYPRHRNAQCEKCRRQTKAVLRRCADNTSLDNFTCLTNDGNLSSVEIASLSLLDNCTCSGVYQNQNRSVPCNATAGRTVCNPLDRPLYCNTSIADEIDHSDPDCCCSDGDEYMRKQHGFTGDYFSVLNAPTLMWAMILRFIELSRLYLWTSLAGTLSYFALKFGFFWDFVYYGVIRTIIFVFIAGSTLIVIARLIAAYASHWMDLSNAQFANGMAGNEKALTVARVDPPLWWRTAYFAISFSFRAVITIIANVIMLPLTFAGVIKEGSYWKLPDLDAEPRAFAKRYEKSDTAEQLQRLKEESPQAAKKLKERTWRLWNLLEAQKKHADAEFMDPPIAEIVASIRSAISKIMYPFSSVRSIEINKEKYYVFQLIGEAGTLLGGCRIAINSLDLSTFTAVKSDAHVFRATLVQYESDGRTFHIGEKSLNLTATDLYFLPLGSVDSKLFHSWNADVTKKTLSAQTTTSTATATTTAPATASTSTPAAVAAPAAAAAAPRTKPACRDWANRGCPRGENCKFEHSGPGKLITRKRGQGGKQGGAGKEQQDENTAATTPAVVETVAAPAAASEERKEETPAPAPAAASSTDSSAPGIAPTLPGDSAAAKATIDPRHEILLAGKPVEGPTNSCWIKSVVVLLYAIACRFESATKHLPADHFMRSFLKESWCRSSGVDCLTKLCKLEKLIGKPGKAMTLLHDVLDVNIPKFGKLSTRLTVNDDSECALKPIGAICHYESERHLAPATAKFNEQSMRYEYSLGAPESFSNFDHNDVERYVYHRPAPTRADDFTAAEGGAGANKPVTAEQYIEDLERDPKNEKCGLCNLNLASHAKCRGNSVAVLCAGPCGCIFMNKCAGDTSQYTPATPFVCGKCQHKMPTEKRERRTIEDNEADTPAAPAATTPTTSTTPATTTPAATTTTSAASPAKTNNRAPDDEAAADMRRGFGGDETGQTDPPAFNPNAAPSSRHESSLDVSAFKGEWLIQHEEPLRDMNSKIANYYKGVPSTAVGNIHENLLVHAWVMLRLRLSTRKLHLSTLIKAIEYAKENLELAKKTALTDFLLLFLQHCQRTGKNRTTGLPGLENSTISRKASALIGGISNLHLYSRGSTVDRPIRLTQSLSFSSAATTLARLSMETQPSGQTAATASQISAAMNYAKRPAARMAIFSMWISTMRVGCTNQLRRRHVEFDKSFDTTGALSFHVAKGKGVLVRKGQYRITTAITDEDLRREFKAYCATITDPDALLFPPADGAHKNTRTREYNLALKQVDQHLCNMAIRRGSLQAMGKGEITGVPVPDDILMTYSGHKSKETLHRYLDWGKHAGERKRAQLRAAEELAEQRAPLEGAAAAAQRSL